MSSSPSTRDFPIGPDLRAALIAMVRKRVPESEVEDIVQSTLADAIGSPHAPTDSESLRRWIFGVAKNKVVDYHRRAGRETFELPENVAGTPAPHAEADLLRWAEKHLPPGEENKTTLDWMLREGEGEKLEWIAENENVPAPRVRQRVSRLRRHLKAHWQKEVALLATLGVLITIFLLVLRKKDPEEIISEDLPRAAEIRKKAFEKCLSNEFKDCLQKLDEAKRLDPAGDTRPEVRQARDNANKALSLPPSPSALPTTTDSTNDNNLTPPPAPSTTTPPVDSSGFLRGPTKGDSKDGKSLGEKQPQNRVTKPVAPKSTEPTPTPTPAPPSKMKAPDSKPEGKTFSPKPSGTDDFGGGSGGTPFGGGKKSAANAPASKSAPNSVDVVGTPPPPPPPVESSKEKEAAASQAQSKSSKKAPASKSSRGAVKGGSGSDFGFGSSL